MELYYFRDKKPNFGDDLNTWMWPKLIEGVLEQDDDAIFLGIGSIIFDFFPVNKRKIVFGAGYGGYTPVPIIDDNWKFYFVRGKLTANTLGIDEGLGIGDGAILLRSCVKHKVNKKHKISFMPHYGSTFIGNWELTCKLGLINYIDPRAPVDNVLENILASELVITEAMHGAIVSDALRVPWIPIQPLMGIHSMKWFDWASALNIELKPHQIISSSFLEAVVQFFDGKDPKTADRFRRRGGALKQIAPKTFAERAAETILNISKNISPSLSSDFMIEKAHDQMLSKLDQLIMDYRKG